MPPRGAVPARTCIGCRQVAPAPQLVRLTVQGDRVVIASRSSGRGAWLHPSEACFRAAVKGRAFGRAFRRPVTMAAPEDFMAALLARV